MTRAGHRGPAGRDLPGLAQRARRGGGGADKHPVARHDGRYRLRGGDDFFRVAGERGIACGNVRLHGSALLEVLNLLISDDRATPVRRRRQCFL